MNHFIYTYHVITFVISIVLVVAFVNVSIAQESTFPDAPGRDALILACTQCHGLDRITRVNLTADEWENALYDMIGRGARVESNDLNKIRRYLISNFAKNP